MLRIASRMVISEVGSDGIPIGDVLLVKSLHHIGTHAEQGVLALELGAFINFGGIVEPGQRLLNL